MHVVVEQCISDAGNLSQALGLGRVVGQMYAYLYFSQSPRGLADMQADLHISKGSASMCVRQLEQWGAVSKVWVKGDRRDYYAANDWFGRVLKNVLTDVIAKRFEDSDSFYDELERTLEHSETTDQMENRFILDRLEHIRRFDRKARDTWNNPLLQRFLK